METATGLLMKEGATPEEKPIVCFLGPVASYSHQATLDGFSPEEWDLMPVVTIQDIFETVQSGNSAYGVVPFENSTNGPVLFTLNGFADYEGRYPDLSVCAEIYVDVHHYLLGYSISPSSPLLSSSPPGAARASGPISGGVFSQSQKCDGRNQALGANLGVDLDLDADVGTSTPTTARPHPKIPRSHPLASLKGVERVYSHPQVWGQCEAFLSTYLKGVEQVDVSSTSKAAEIVLTEGPPPISPQYTLSSARASQGLEGDCVYADGARLDDVVAGAGTGAGGRTRKTGRSMAISSLVAAQMTGLDVLAKCIEDRDDNTTRFFVIRKDGEKVPLPERLGMMPSSSSPSRAKTSAEANTPASSTSNSTPKTKSMLRFTIPHTSPGALANVLSCFRRGGLNLTSISSRPSLREPFTYVFFVEFYGHVDPSLDPGGRVRRVLEEVEGCAREWKWLGSWVVRR